MNDVQFRRTTSQIAHICVTTNTIVWIWPEMLGRKTKSRETGIGIASLGNQREYVRGYQRGFAFRDIYDGNGGPSLSVNSKKK